MLSSWLRSLLFVFASVSAFAAELVKLEVDEIEPVRVETRGETLFVDFGKDAFANLKLQLPADPTVPDVIVRLGEKLGGDGAIARRPGGSVNYREIRLALEPGKRTYQLTIPSKPFHKRGQSVQMPAEIGEVTPFRYVEIEGGAKLGLDKASLRQLAVRAPFDDKAATFASSDETLNAVWELCHYSMKATSAFGVYIDGERERIPYEADAYLNQLSHYACDLDPRVARYTVDYLLKHPTWPTEWSLHMPMMAAADYLATGDIVVAAEHYDVLKKKLLMDKAREDGLLRAWAIVDWPNAERDGYNDGQLSPKDNRQIGPEINTVVNAFYYHALRQMALLATALKKDTDAREFETKASQVYESFNRVFFDTQRGLYIDGEGSTHASMHANMFPLAFGLVPQERRTKVGDFVESRGMACSVYGAQYLLEALFGAGKDEHAVQLMAAKTKRSWWHMIELGSTITLEAWDAEFKPNLTWNHAWGAAPANILTRFVLGVQPAEPGYKKMTIAPQLGGLKWVRGKVPTAVGPVTLRVDNAAVFKLEVTIPAGTSTKIVLPAREKRQVAINGRVVPSKAVGNTLVVEGILPGRHVIESR